MLGIEEIYLDENDIYKEQAILSNIQLSDIEHHPYFDRYIWNEYADKKANFLILKSPVSGIMDGVDPAKIARAEYIKRKTSEFYKNLQISHQIPWCIAALPNQNWANKVFDNNVYSFNLLEKAIFEVCMIDENDPIENWNKQLEKNKLVMEKLNNLKIKILENGKFANL